MVISIEEDRGSSRVHQISFRKLNTHAKNVCFEGWEIMFKIKSLSSQTKPDYKFHIKTEFSPGAFQGSVAIFLQICN